MSSGVRLFFLSAVALIVLYYGLVVIMRSFGVELPDPIKLLVFLRR
jgi:hypothetical protein